MTLTEEEKYEALSKRYVDAARVIRLDSGKFVIFSMVRGEIIGTAEEPEINSQLGEAIDRACAISYQSWVESRRLEKLGHSSEPEEPMTATADEMGL